MIALIDYGAGNLTSVRKALTALGAEFFTPRGPEELAAVDGIIVPGVGHFSATRPLVGPWLEAVRITVGRGTPLLGICVGMQWLFEGSDEAPDVPGLGALPGRVALLRGNSALRLKIPHVGWNALEPGNAGTDGSSGEAAPAFRGRLLAGLEPGAHVYFTHSYAAPVTTDCVGAATHTSSFSAVVERDRVFGVQFHPEKSGDAGLHILRNYLDVCRS